MTIVAAPEQRDAIAEIVFRETTTIGIRHQELSRECLDREMVTVDTARPGPLQGRAPRGARPERAAGVRRPGEPFRGAGHPSQGRPGRGAEGVARYQVARTRPLAPLKARRLRSC